MNRYNILLKKKPPKPKPRIRPDWESFGNCTVEIEKTLYKNALIREVARSAVDHKPHIVGSEKKDEEKVPLNTFSDDPTQWIFQDPIPQGMAFGFRNSYGREMIRVFNIVIHAHVFISSPNIPIVVHGSTFAIDFRIHSYHSTQNPDGDCYTEIEGEIPDNFPLQL
jgi:hypothetical protein